jgi:hypothetical protein
MSRSVVNIDLCYFLSHAGEVGRCGGTRLDNPGQNVDKARQSPVGLGRGRGAEGPALQPGRRPARADQTSPIKSSGLGAGDDEIDLPATTC